MKKQGWLFFCIAIFSWQIHAASLEQHFNTLLQNQLPNANVAFYVQDLENNSVLYESRSKENFYPASNTKLFTAVAALKQLGKDFQFETSLYQHDNNIYLRFSGDPSLSTDDLFRLLQTLKINNITSIEGHFIIDDTLFDNNLFAPGWTLDSAPWYYAAPVHTIILNENKVRFHLAQTKKLGQKIVLTQEDKHLGHFKLEGLVKAVTNEEADSQCSLLPTIKNNEFTVNGCWPLEKTPTTLEMAIDNPRLLAANRVKEYLKKLNIALKGNIVFAKTPHQVAPLSTHKSPPLSVLLTGVLADSNNLYTESLTKTLGLSLEGKGSFQAGTRAIAKILKNKMQVNLESYRLSDGSGQSRYNLVTAEQISALLSSLYRDPDFHILYSTLSVAGKTGTLSNRLTKENTIGKVVAKTGSARGTSALSGYLISKSGKPYLFVMMINQATKRGADLKDFEDKLCHILIEEPWLHDKQHS